MGLTLTACTFSNKNENQNEKSMNTTLQLTQEWDKVFPKSDKVTHEKVTFKKAAEAAGHEVTLVNVAKKKIAGCLACEYCHNKGNGACIQKDDMQELCPLMNEAEVLVLAGREHGLCLCQD